MTSGLPFDDFRNLLAGLPDRDAAAAGRVADALSRYDGKVAGRLAAIAEWLAGWSGRTPPRLTKPLVAIFAATHGVAQRLAGGDHTQRLVEHAAAGGALVSQVCATNDLGLKIFDLALDMPTADITAHDAMDERGCAATMAFGMEAVAGGTDLVVVGAMGAGGEIPAAAILSALYGRAPVEWIGEGAPAELATAALAFHQGRLGDPIETLRRLAGRELAAIAGAILAARMQRIPVILDGFVTLAAAAALKATNATALDHCLAGHASAEPGQARALAALGLVPVLDLGIGSGDGAGGALAAGIVRAAAQTALAAMAAG